MIGTILSIDGNEVTVDVPDTFPGAPLPAKALIHRVAVDGDDYFTHYAEGDVVHVVEDTPNDFLVTGIIQGG